MSFYGFRPYVSVAQRRHKAERTLAGLSKKGQPISPVRIEGRTIARSFWGKSWCDNLERYSDFASRLPRGRSYVRNGSVLDLQIARGEVRAMVSGSELYTVQVDIAPATAKRWKAICRDSAGSIDSLVELLQGRLSERVMDRVCREGDGLFPSPREIDLSCSCPDWADMCKHVAAALYGIGARLDSSPELLFRLRGVDETELLANADRHISLRAPAPAGAKVLDDGDAAALFGLEMAEQTGTGSPAEVKRQPAKKSRRAKGRAGEQVAASKKGKRRAPAPSAGSPSAVSRRKSRKQTRTS
ncbi:MAG: SWIM zinc finger family protein [Hyphomicrobiaceae bacterium]